MTAKSLLAGLAPDIQLALQAEARRLLALLPDDPRFTARVAGDAGGLLSAAPPGSVQVNRSDKWPLVAFLAKPARADLPRADQLDLLRAWALAATLVFCAVNPSLSDRDSPVKSGLRMARRLSTRSDLDASRASLPPVPNDLHAIKGMLNRWEGQLARRGSSYAPRIAELRRLIECLPKGEATPRRPGAGHRPNVAKALVHPPLPRLAGGSASQCRLFRALPADLSDSDAPRNVEEAADIAAPVLLDLGFAPPQRCSSARAAIETRLDLVEAAEVGGAGWTGAYAALDPEELRRLIAAIRAEIAGDTPQFGALTCALLILTGRPLAQLCALREGASFPGESWRVPQGLAYSPDVTDADQKKINKNSMVIEFEPALADALTKLGRCLVEEAEDAARAWLKETLTGGRAPRLSRLSRALADRMRAIGEDEAAIGLLSGAAVDQAAQLYYANFAVGRLDAAYCRFLESIDWATCARVSGLGRTQRIGSLRAPSRTEVQAFFRTLGGEMEAAQMDFARSVQALPVLVAAVNNRAAAVLNLAVGRRPHGFAFEPLQIVGERRPRVRITDKGSRLVSDARWLPLPPFALEAINAWWAELGRIEARLGNLGSALNRPLFDYMRAARAGEVPPFFGLDSLIDPPAPLSVAALWDRAGTPGTSPRNWARHFLRRELPEAGLSGALIDGFMGHGGAVSDPLAPTSGASAAQLDSLIRAIEAICGPLVKGGGHG